jgi:uncharacterized membrane protein
MGRINSVSFIYFFVFSLFATILYGLIVNSLLPLVGIVDPLSIRYVWPVYLLFVLTFFKFATDVVKWLKENPSSWYLNLVLLFNPIIAIAGVYHLDNTGSGFIAVISVLMICLLFPVIFFLSKHKYLDHQTLQVSLYSAALSLILANSLRSNYLVGYDIHQEFLVFRLTNLHNFWSMDTFRDAYNACLSITILPTIIRNLTGLSHLFIFRFIYPLLIALIPVVVYKIGTRHFSRDLAYAGGFIFLIQSQYISQLPALLRQGLAFLFFSITIDLLIRCDIPKKYTNIGFLIFSTGIVLSHYSTTYTTIAVLIIAKIVITILQMIFIKHSEPSRLSFRMIVYLIAIALTWNIIITDTAGGLISTISKVSQNIGTIFTLENKSDMVKSIFYVQSSNDAAVKIYESATLDETKNPELFSGYEIKPVEIVNGRRPSLKNPFAVYFHILIPWLFRLSIIVGFGITLLRVSKSGGYSTIIGLLAAMIVVIALILILPFVSVNYNFERLFQQMLVLLAPISILGIIFIFKSLKQNWTTLIVSVILVSYLLQTTGLADKIVFDAEAWMFGNGGDKYYRYYSTDAEVAGLQWLDKETPLGAVLFADKYTRLRNLAYTSNKYSWVSSEINPPIIHNQGYVFSGFAGTEAKIVFADVKTKPLHFTYPEAFLNRFNSKIYSTKKVKVYK